MTPTAFRQGAVQLVTVSGRRNMLNDGVATLLYYPPNAPATAKGRVLVCSNLHWLANSSYWNGGTFSLGDGQRRLLLNFLAGAVAARVGRVCPSS